MSLAEACGWTCLRSLLIATCAIPVCFAIRRQLRAARGGRRLVLWIAVLAPFFAPDMLVGYGYYNFSLSLIHHPVWNELFYAVLVFFKVLPAGTVIALFTPRPPISLQALYCRRLSLPPHSPLSTRAWTLAGYYLRGPSRVALPALVLMFLLAFQEFELVSLVNATSWTVWLFDQQAQGLPLPAALRYDLLPTGIQAALIAAMIPLVLMSRKTAGQRDSGGGTSTAIAGVAWGVAIIGCVLLWLIPMAILCRGLGSGLVVLWRNPRLFYEIGIGLGMMLAAALPTYALAAALLSATTKQRGQRWRLPLAVLVGLPGLFGGLTLGLAMLALFQTPALGGWYDTPLPWWSALVLWLMPRAMLLQILLASARRGEPVHLAALLIRDGSPQQRGRARQLIWRLRYQGHYWAIVLLCWWAYLDPTLSSLLRPSGLDPAPMRIYNFMHYGQAGGLSAMLAVTVLAPLLLVGCLSLLRRFLFPLLERGSRRIGYTGR
ncbi:hypothetical protein Pan258_41670 [Symmachiella dynata]|uniref:hypothetical protein n=1 Tax=Symmachiella dynata TaxID=2527995 RepID=UPI001189224B|nr:hypothetical protein [Symmachiella dynata]QDT50111.1 hypothetical protein Pan258_41670 [Symmachiella dynata]